MRTREIFIIVLLLPCLNSSGQDTIYYKDGNKTTSLQSADYYGVVWHDPADANKATEKTYFKTGQIRTEAYFSDYEKKTYEGDYKEYYENGQLREDIGYKNGKLNGHVLTFWENGEPKRIDSFYNGKFIEGKCFSASGNAIAHTDFLRMPEFPGGPDALMNFLRAEIRYPEKARRRGIQGRVIVEFTVRKNGAISNIRIVQRVSSALNREALRVIKKMPKWNPGIKDGKAVNVLYSLPVQFRLE